MVDTPPRGPARAAQGTLPQVLPRSHVNISRELADPRTDNCAGDVCGDSGA